MTEGALEERPFCGDLLRFKGIAEHVVTFVTDKVFLECMAERIKARFKFGYGREDERVLVANMK